MRRWVLLTGILITVIPLRGQSDHYLAGRAAMCQENFDSAVLHLEKAKEKEPGNVEILYHLGISYFNLQEVPAAREAFYSVEKRRSGMGSLYLARTEVRLDHPEQALKYLRVHLDSRYKVPESEILLDEDLNRLEGRSDWQALWEEKRWYNSGDEEFREASYLKENGNELEAINILNKLEKQAYKRSLVQEEKAAIYKALGNERAARSELESAVKSDVRNLDALQLLSNYQVEDGSYEEAISGLNRVLRQDPARFDAYIERARARSLNDDLTGAMEDMNLYLSYFPGDDAAIFLKGKMEYDHHKYLDAIQSYNLALEMNSSNPEYYFARGMTYAATGTTRYAEKDMSMALDLDPLNGEIWFEKGLLSEKLGHGQDACYCFQNALRYGIFEAREFIDQSCK